jgi:anaerobic selenocysteine-containing dehydrogenase
MSFTNTHDRTRDLIEAVIPGFTDYNQRVRKKGGFYLPNGPRDGPTWNTPSGKAVIHSHKLPEREIPDDRFILMTLRSHDQYDRYRGIYNSRRIVMMNSNDMDELGLRPRDEIDLTSHFEGREILAEKWKVVPYEIPRKNLAAYFPEANVLVPLDSVAKGSNTPTSKWIEVSLKPRKD